MILPDGVCIASFAGFSRPAMDRVEEIAEVDAENSFELLDIVEPPAVLETMLIALDGRLKTEGEALPLIGMSSFGAD